MEEIQPVVEHYLVCRSVQDDKPRLPDRVARPAELGMQADSGLD